MKRTGRVWLGASLLMLALVAMWPSVEADEEYRYYFPSVQSGYYGEWEGAMSDWKLVVPEGMTNKVLNPSAETTGNYTAESGTTVTRSSSYSKYGLYSFRVQCNANNEGVRFTLGTLANAAHYVTLRVRGTLPAAWDWSLNGSAYHAPTLLESLDDDWDLYGYAFSAAEANGSTTLRVHQNGSGSGDFYIDGIQVEQADHWTTYCDGDQEGCEWNGAEHGSTSQRSAQSRAGGRVYDLKDDYYFGIVDMIDTGAPRATLAVDEYAMLPGGELNAMKVHAREFTLVGNIQGTSKANLLARRQALVEELAADRYPKDADGWQPVRLRYEGGTVHKEIAAHYLEGLGAQLAPENILYEKLALKFVATDPWWYEIGESAQALGVNASATVRVVAGRVDGAWDAMGPPDSSGTYSYVMAIAEDETYIYLGGNFTNFDNIAAADYVVRYNKATGAYSALSATTLGGIVTALAVGPDGTLYIGGSFQNVGGDANADYIVAYDGSSFSALTSSNPLASAVNAIAIGQDGTVYIGGNFTNAGGDADADYVCQYDGSSFSALCSTVLNNTVNALAVGPDGTLYVGGTFTNVGSDADADYVVQFDGSDFSALCDDVLDDEVHAISCKSDGTVYVGGDFTQAGSDTDCRRICEFNGVTFVPLSTGVNDEVWSSAITPAGDLIIGGKFTDASDLSVADRMARWNGSSWCHVDADLPGSPYVYAILASSQDPVVEENYDLYIGFSTTGTATWATATTVTNDGNAAAYPVITVERSGGGGAKLESIRNETVGEWLLFNYNLQDGEMLTIDLRPTRKSVVSSFFGPRPDAVLNGSDFGQFHLQPGENSITCMITESSSPTLAATMEWRDAYRSMD